MDRDTSLLLTERSYDNPDELKRNLRSNDKTKNYKLIRNMSSDDVRVFKNLEDNSFHITHRGTDNIKDVKTDVELALGQGDNSKDIQNRQQQTKLIVDKFKGRKITASGHSLGGYSITQTMTDPFIADNVSMVHTFNGASLPHIRTHKEVKHDLTDKIIHHRNDKDIVSLGHGLRSLKGMGKVIHYKSDTNNELKAHRLDFFKTNPKPVKVSPLKARLYAERKSIQIFKVPTPVLTGVATLSKFIRPVKRVKNGYM
jgi:hypothetical protein|tara:strand:- start:417 stop:1184 length:768 start_codon:yes stop_codon:yes gene_type:complete